MRWIWSQLSPFIRPMDESNGNKKAGPWGPAAEKSLVEIS